jgi:hypothetical protein
MQSLYFVFYRFLIGFFWVIPKVIYAVVYFMLLQNGIKYINLGL